jgi:hypothetical protein
MPGAPIGTAIGAGITGAAGLAQAISGATKTEADKQREERLRRLAALVEQNQLGLTGPQRQLAERQLLDPIRRGAQQSQTRAEQIAAASGAPSGAALSRLRTESARQIQEGAQTAAARIQAADIAREQAQLAEQAQLQAVQEARQRERRGAIFGGISQAAGAAGAVAGSVPELLRVSDIAGAPIRDVAGFQAALDRQGIPPAAQEIFLAMNPAQLTRTLKNLTDAVAAGTDVSQLPPEEQQLFEALLASEER